MATVTFRDGFTVSDGADPVSGLALGGHRTRFVPALAHAVDVALESKEWANKLSSTVFDAEYSAKEYAVGSTAPTGSSKNWANKTGSAVANNEYSAREYAVGVSVPSGSAKTHRDAALGYANSASTSATASAASAASSLSSKDRVEVIYSELQGGGDITTSFIRFNPNLITEDITFATDDNGMTAGPIGVALNKTITVTEGSVWSII